MQELRGKASEGPYLEVGEVLCHETVDLTHRQAASPAIPQSHENKNAEKKYEETFRLLIDQLLYLNFLCLDNMGN